MGVTKPQVRAILWLLAGGVGHEVIESVLSPRLDAALPPGGWHQLGVPPAMFIPIEIAGLLVACAALAGLAAVISAGMLWRHFDLAADLPVRFAYLGAWLFLASWPLETVFLFIRGNHVPGSPSGAMIALASAGLLACQAVALWQVWRARRDFRAASRDDAGDDVVDDVVETV
ncbi:MAG TPA: hypothetical protein VF362_03690 [Demequinaceae bacterium]